jgi:hypothetical protein
MAKIPCTFAAVERYELVRDRVAGGVDPAVPEDAVRHACLLPKEPWIVGSIWAKVAEPFDSEHPKACQRCMDSIGLKGS